ncbi:MAG: Ig-like domain-containing protein, partial [Spirochaetes bacterium]|nr:Ig-like domain-containing protein [Spirochaetota bacterium]
TSTTFTGDGKPYIVAIYPDDPHTIYVEWSETLGGTIASDYAITGINPADISVSMYPSAPSNMVKVTISPSALTSGTSYTLSLPGLPGTTDAAPANNTASNTIPSGGTFTGPSTTQAPQITSASSSSPTTVVVNFNEPLNNATIQAADFTLTGVGCPTVVSVATPPVQVAAGVVLLTITATAPSSTATCTVTVNAGLVADLAGNTIAGTNNTATYQYNGSNLATPDTTAPTVVSVVSTSNTQIKVFFSEPVTVGGNGVPNAGDNIANYSFSPSVPTPFTVSCLGSVCTIDIPAPGQSAVQYGLTVSNVQDQATVPNTMTSQTVNFSGTGSSVTAPTLYAATLINSTTVELSFSEIVDLTTSQVAGSYTVSGGNTVSAAVRQADATKVRLTITPGAFGSANTYTATITGTINDLNSPANSVAVNSTATFSGSATAPAQTDLFAATDLGTSSTDNLTSAVPLTFTGTVAANTIVNLYDDGVLVATAVSNGSGLYSVTLNSAATLTTGANLFTVATVGSTGLVSDVSPSLTVTWDNTAPTINNTPGVTSSVANGAYGPGSVIPITVLFNDVVYVDTTGGTPQLRLNVTPTTRYATYTSGSGTNTLTFTYTVQAGDASADLNYTLTTDLSANSGTIKDAAGNNAVLTLAGIAAAGSLGTNKDINVVGTATGAITYAQGANTAGPFKAGALTITATYALDPGAIPNINSLTGVGSAGLGPVAMTQVSATVYTYTYTVVTNNGTTNIDGTGTLTLSTASSNNTFIIDTIAPAAPGTPDLTAATDTGVSSTDNVTTNTTPQFDVTCAIGASVQLYVDAVATGTAATCSSSPVTLTAGTLSEGTRSITAMQTDPAGNTSVASGALSVKIDNTAPTAPSGVSVLTYTNTTSADVTFVPGTDANITTSNVKMCTANDCATGCVGATTGNSPVNVSGLTNGTAYYGCVQSRDLASNTSSFVASGTTVTVDTTAPTVTGVTSSTADGRYKAGDAISIQVSFSENVTVTGTPQLTLSTGSPATTAVNYVSGSGTSTLTFTYTIAAGNTSADLDYNAAGSLSSGTSIQDAAGNNATLTLANPGATGSLGANKAIVVDTTAPVISAVTPASSSSVNNTSVGYTLSEVCASGSVTWTRTGGSADAGGSPAGTHTQALAGAELNAGAFSGTITNNPTLVDGTIYSVAFNCTDLAGNVATTVTSTSVTYSPGVLTITSAETLDTNNNGKIDTYRIGFNKSVNDSTFPGYSANALGTMTTNWLVAGFTNVRLIHGTAVTFATDTANDAVIYLRFDENLLTCSAATQVGCDTEAKPDLTTTATPGLQDLTAATIAQVNTGSVTEADGAKPILVAAKSLGTTSADAIFSETVETTTSQTIDNYVITLGGGLTVSAATRDGTNTNVVHLTTSTQTGGTTYLLTVNTNVKDLANFNLNASANTANFDGVTKPVVSSIITKSATTLLITYNEVVTFGSTECSGLTACSAIYTNTSLPVLSAVSSNSSGTLTAGTNSQYFILTVNPMIEGQAYTTTVTQNTVTSVATGQKMGNTNNSATFNGDGKPAPTISTDTATECPTPTLAPVPAAARRVVVQYDQAVGASATVAANYSITACLDSTPAAALCASGNPQANATTVTNQGANKYTVDFGTNFDTDVSRYQLTIANVLDTNGNAVATPTNLAFRCGTDLTPPSLVGISVVSATAGSTVLLLTFSEAVDNVTGNVATNYKYDTNAYGFNVNSAARQTNTAQVQVTFSPAVANGGHQLLVQNVTDLTGNVILANGVNNAQPFIVNAPTGFSGGPVFTDPFADGTPAGQMIVYDNKIVLGWDGNSSKFFEMDKGLTTAQTITLDADGASSFPATQFKNYASGSSGTLQGLDAINAGCVGGTSTSSMTGTTCTVTNSGTEYIIAGAFNLTGAYQSVFRSTDKSSSNTKFTFTERGGLDQSGNTYRSMTMTFFKNYLIVASPHIGSFAPRVSRVCALPSGACSNGETSWNTPT